MLDLVFVVDDPIEWHAENLQQNWRHYSFLRYLGTGTVARVQRYPAGLYYNTLVNIQSQVRIAVRLYVKYIFWGVKWSEPIWLYEGWWLASRYHLRLGS